VTTPFFSIVIPTRNRCQLLDEALLSALNQDFDDFEVVVSDNSSEDATQTVIDTYRSDPRLTAVRTAELLSMNKHWEFATQKTHGRYVLLLTDRSVLKRHALRTIHDAIQSSEHEILACSWRWSLFDDEAQLEFADRAVVQRDGVLELTSREVAQNFADGKAAFSYDLPRALNSCYRSDLAETIRSKHGAMFVPISPDFTSAFYVLAYAEHLLFIDSALFISQGLKQSTGGSTVGSIAAANQYMKSLDGADYYAHVPIKIALVENLIFEDFLAIQEKAGGNLHGIALDWPNYFVANYRELINKNATSPWANEEQVALLREWERALAGFDNDTRQEVRRRTAGLKGVKFKSLIRNTPMGRLLARMKRRLDSRGDSGRTILAQAGFDTLHKRQ
jgi:glycosyltransferase involved in cell wall biosynthesis